MVQEVLNSPCPSGERYKLIPKRLNRLVYEAGITDPIRLKSILDEWIDNRPANLPREYVQIEYFKKNHFGLRKKTNPAT